MPSSCHRERSVRLAAIVILALLTLPAARSQPTRSSSDLDRLREEISRLKASDATPRNKLRALYTRVAAHFEAKRALPHIMLREILAGGKGIDAEASRTLFVILSFVSETIREGVRTGEFREVDPLLLHLSILAPLMVHHVGDSFRERILPREMPGVQPPTHDAMLQHLLISLERSLAPQTPLPARPQALTQRNSR